LFSIVTPRQTRASPIILIHSPRRKFLSVAPTSSTTAVSRQRLCFQTFFLHEFGSLPREAQAQILKSTPVYTVTFHMVYAKRVRQGANFPEFLLRPPSSTPGAAARPLTRRRACRRAGVTFSATPRLQTLTAQSAPAAVATSAARGYHVPGGRGQGRGGGGGRRGRGGGRGKYGGNLVMRATSTRDRWRQGRGGGE
jgi:hypothetical protein